MRYSTKGERTFACVCVMARKEWCGLSGSRATPLVHARARPSLPALGGADGERPPSPPGGRGPASRPRRCAYSARSGSGTAIQCRAESRAPGESFLKICACFIVCRIQCHHSEPQTQNSHLKISGAQSSPTSTRSTRTASVDSVRLRVSEPGASATARAEAEVGRR
jgi:hypothetical protein